MQTQPISAEFPFESKYLDVLGSKMHYLDEGEGAPIVLLHGNPSSVYLWRNIVPHLTPHGRVIAPDLIGMGKSDKPDIDYRFQDHYRYLAAFLDQLGLDPMTLVVHDWGSALGLHYAYQHPEQVTGLGMMEAMLRPLTWAGFEPKIRVIFKMMRAPGIGWLMVRAANMFVKQVVPQGIVRQLTDEEKAAWEAPFATVSSRKPVHVWPKEIPIDGSPADMHELMSRYSKWLTETEIPKLLFVAHPGATVNDEVADWAQSQFTNLDVVDVGEGTHFIQEDQPDLIGSSLAAWITKHRVA